MRYLSYLETLRLFVHCTMLPKSKYRIWSPPSAPDDVDFHDGGGDDNTPIQRPTRGSENQTGAALQSGTGLTELLPVGTKQKQSNCH